jgi:hypothetical protein
MFNLNVLPSFMVNGIIISLFKYKKYIIGINRHIVTWHWLTIYLCVIFKNIYLQKSCVVKKKKN